MRRQQYLDSTIRQLTKSMSIAMTDLKLDQLFIIFPGTESFPVASDIQAVGLVDYLLKNK